jgi:prepilin-type processing-associated H-X9-DG protein
MNTQDPGKAIAADRNPYSNHVQPRSSNAALSRGGVQFPTGYYGHYQYKKNKDGAKALGFAPPPSADDSETYLTLLRTKKTANSRNHKQEGQNVCYLDGHAKWGNNPKVGVDDDSIWSNWVAAAVSPTNPGGFAVNKDKLPYDAEPPADAAYGLMRAKSNWATDSVLLP